MRVSGGGRRRGGEMQGDNATDDLVIVAQGIERESHGNAMAVFVQKVCGLVTQVVAGAQRIHDGINEGGLVIG